MKKFALCLPVLAGILWGATGVFVRYLGSAGLSNLSIVFSRSSIAVVLMLLYLLIFNRSILKIHIRDLWCFAGCGLLGMMGLNLCYNAAIGKLSLSLAAVLLSMSPVFVLFLAAILFHEKITSKKVLCMCLAVIGCVLVSGLPEQIAAGSAGNLSVLGVVCGLAAAFFYALYSVFSKIAMDKGYHTYTIIFYSVLTITVVLAPFANYGEIFDYVSAAPAVNLILLVLHSLCASVLPYIFFTLALIYAEAGKVSILAASSEPSAASVFGIFFFREIPTVLGWMGLAITIAALGLLCRKEKEKS